MADVTPILIKDLAAQTTLADTDYFIVGGADAKKITVAQMKEALGINELNTNMEAEVYLETNWNGLHIRVFRTMDGIFFGMRGSLTTTLTAGTDYTIPVPDGITETLAGSYCTQDGRTGYIRTLNGYSITLTPFENLSGWILCSTVLVFAL